MLEWCHVSLPSNCLELFKPSKRKVTKNTDPLTTRRVNTRKHPPSLLNVSNAAAASMIAYKHPPSLVNWFQKTALQLVTPQPKCMFSSYSWFQPIRITDFKTFKPTSNKLVLQKSCEPLTWFFSTLQEWQGHGILR